MTVDKIRRSVVGEIVRMGVILIALAIVSTICWGFIDRGQQVRDSLRIQESNAALIVDLTEQNEDLRIGLLDQAKEAKSRSAVATADRAELEEELRRIFRWLKRNEIGPKQR